MRTLNIESYEEYKRIMGLSSVDVGSRLQLIRETAKKLKAKGYKTAKIYKMPTKQLRAIYKTL